MSAPRPSERTSSADAATDLLARMPRADRVRALWAAMPPGARERGWARLRDGARVDLIASLFDAEELR